MVRKSRVLIWFFCCIVGGIGLGLSIYTSLAHGNLLFGSLGMILFFTFGLAAIVMTLNLLAFPLPYSVFGRMLKTPFPAVPPLTIIAKSWGIIGKVRCTIPFVTWHIFDNGLGIELGGFENVYLPYENITDIQRVRFGNYKVLHTCPEVRSPIVVPETTFQAMKSSSSEKDQSCFAAICNSENLTK
jgi:hypothetical protein